MLAVGAGIEYDPDRPLCRGGAVFAGRYHGKRVAVKLSHRSAAALHAREVEVYRMLRDHPNVCKYEHEHTDDRNAYLVMELCGRTLKEHVATPEFAAAPDSVRAEVNRGIIAGLAHLHTADLDDDGSRVCHNDLHPGNVLLKASSRVPGGWQPKIADMGLGKVLGGDEKSSFAMSNMAPAKNEWRSPEIFDLLRGKRPTVTKKVDVFAAGLLLFYVGTGGAHPYSAGPDDFPGELELRIAKREEPKNLGALTDAAATAGPGGPRSSARRIELRHLVEMMLAADPEDRPSMEEAAGHVYFYDAAARATLIKAARDAGPAARKRLERCKEDAVGPGPWTDAVDPALLAEMHERRAAAGGGGAYRGGKLLDLVTAARNLIEHLHEYSEAAVAALLSAAAGPGGGGEAAAAAAELARQDVGERRAGAKEAAVAEYFGALFPGLVLQLAVALE
jgi:serine/threonine protein kinase